MAAAYGGTIGFPMPTMLPGFAMGLPITPEIFFFITFLLIQWDCPEVSHLHMGNSSICCAAKQVTLVFHTCMFHNLTGLQCTLSHIPKISWFFRKKENIYIYLSPKSQLFRQNFINQCSKNLSGCLPSDPKIQWADQALLGTRQGWRQTSDIWSKRQTVWTEHWSTVT